MNPREDAPLQRELAAALAHGSTLGHWRIDSLVSAGEHAYVYQATDLLLGRRLAIKELFAPALVLRGIDGRTVLPRSVQAGERFERGVEALAAEAGRLASLAHPAVVPVWSLVPMHQTLLLAMPWLGAVNLQQHRLNGLAWTAEAWAARVGQLAQAVAHWHAAGRTHGYLHPGQVVISPEGQAHLLGGDALAQALGTPLPPGVHAASYVLDPGAADPQDRERGDLYGLGALAFFAAVGEPPLQPGLRLHEPPEAIAARLANALNLGDTPAAPWAARLRVVALALAPAAEQRPASAQDFVQAFAPEAAAVPGAPVLSPVLPAVPQETPPSAQLPQAPAGEQAVYDAIQQLLQSIPDASPATPPVSTEPSAPPAAAAAQPPQRIEPPWQGGASPAGELPIPDRPERDWPILGEPPEEESARPAAAAAAAAAAAPVARRPRRAAVLAGLVVLTAAIGWLWAPGTWSGRQPGADATAVAEMQAPRTAAATGLTPAPETATAPVLPDSEPRDLPDTAPVTTEAPNAAPTDATNEAPVVAAAEQPAEPAPAAVAEPTATPPAPSAMAQTPPQRASPTPRPAAPTRQVAAATPRAACGARENFSLLWCMQRQCEQAHFRPHAQCVQLRRTGDVG